MARNLEKRLEPKRLVPGACSVVCLAVSYAPAAPRGGGPVARYARGRDYHKVLKRRCHRLMDHIRQIAPDFEGRAFVDSAPVMERSLAAAAGVGWIGRNGCLVVPGIGSYVVLCEVVSNLPLAPDAPLPAECAQCGKCVEACPTGAIAEGGLVDARRCISYLTIEHRGEVPPELQPAFSRRVFGCDACQEACPFNANPPPGDAELLAGADEMRALTAEDVLGWAEADWDAATRGRATRRADYAMFRRNAAIAVGNAGDDPV
jgi:epoxyqueuosine reductase